MAIATSATLSYTHNSYAGAAHTSGSVSLPATGLVVLFVDYITDGTISAMTITNSGTALTWTAIGDSTGGTGMPRRYAFYAKNTSSQSVTITATGTASGASYAGVGMSGHALTGHDTTTPVQATIGGGGTNATATNDFTTPSLTVDNAGRMYGSFLELSYTADETSTSSDATLVGGGTPFNGFYSGFGFKSVASGSRTLNFNATGSGSVNNYWLTFAVAEPGGATNYNVSATASTGATATAAGVTGRVGAVTAASGVSVTATALVARAGEVTASTGATVTAAASVISGVTGDATAASGVAVTATATVATFGAVTASSGATATAEAIVAAGAIFGDVTASTGATVTAAALVARLASATAASGASVTVTASVTGAGIAAVLTVAIDPPSRASGEIVGP
jgi:hypothetical protein